VCDEGQSDHRPQNARSALWGEATELITTAEWNQLKIEWANREDGREVIVSIEMTKRPDGIWEQDLKTKTYTVNVAEILHREIEQMMFGVYGSPIRKGR
jgi:hypothetical protein